MVVDKNDRKVPVAPASYCELKYIDADMFSPGDITMPIDRLNKPTTSEMLSPQCSSPLPPNILVASWLLVLKLYATLLLAL